jgi:hypothetical protein
MRRGLAIAVAAAAIALGPGGAAASYQGINWVELLPPLASSSEAQPGPLPHCKKPRPKCIRVAIRRMKELRDRFGCDHRGVFATTYLVLTRELLRTLRQDPDFLDDRKYLYSEVTLFASYYFKTMRAAERGGEVPEAWEIALRTAREGEVNAGQDMLLGINAHVQSDMPFVLAALGLRTPDRESRKPDHDAANRVLGTAYQKVVDEVERRYDPLLATTNPEALPADDAAGLELVRTWREKVWRNAERLSNAGSEAERRQIAQQIESYAAGWAQGIAAVQVPGERERRAAYCEARRARS